MIPKRSTSYFDLDKPFKSDAIKARSRHSVLHAASVLLTSRLSLISEAAIEIVITEAAIEIVLHAAFALLTLRLQ